MCPRRNEAKLVKYTKREVLILFFQCVASKHQFFTNQGEKETSCATHIFLPSLLKNMFAVKASINTKIASQRRRKNPDQSISFCIDIVCGPGMLQDSGLNKSESSTRLHPTFFFKEFILCSLQL